MFIRMFKADSRSVKKTEQPAALKLDAGPKPHPLCGVFKTQAVDYQGRPVTTTRKADRRPTPDRPSASPKPVKAKPKTIEGMPEIHASLTQMLASVKDVAGTVAALNTRIRVQPTYM